MTEERPHIAPIWEALNAGVQPGRSAFSMIYLATNGVDGAPKMRTVVIRRLDAAKGSIGFNTDLRSPKAAELSADGRVSVLAYDSSDGIQLRLDGEATLHREGAKHSAAWQASASRSRICYRHAYAPGTPLRAPEMADPTVDMVAPDDANDGVENFGAVEILINRIDYLDLNARGHRRAIFDRTDAGWTGRWVAP